jgi:hypothetical protein
MRDVTDLEVGHPASEGVSLNPDLSGAGDSAAAVAAAVAAHEEGRALAKHGRISPAAADGVARASVEAQVEEIDGVQEDQRREIPERSVMDSPGEGTASRMRPFDPNQRTPQHSSPGGERMRPFDPSKLTPHYSSPAVERGELWWAQTGWWQDHLPPGLSQAWHDGARAVMFDGDLFYNNDNLLMGSIGARAIFGLGTDRMPPKGRYISAPWGNVEGSVIGRTGKTFSGDNWAKCWEHLDQTVRNGSGEVLGNEHRVQRLIFLEADGKEQIGEIPQKFGDFPFPPVSFDLDPKQPLTVTVEVRFDVQLEGESMFAFWPMNGGFLNSNAHMLVLGNYQWTLQRS